MSTPIRHSETGLRDYRPELREEFPNWLATLFLGIVCVVFYLAGYLTRDLWVRGLWVLLAVLLAAA